MKTRDYFAAQAMQAIIGKFPPIHAVEDDEAMYDFMELVAKGAYAYADAMMEHRNNEE